MPAPSAIPSTTPSADALTTLPKVLLHDHLDGSLRLSTLLAGCRALGVAAPAEDQAALARWFEANAMAGSLERYLEGFGLTVAAMAREDLLAQVAFEAAEDARAEGCVLAELRMAPLLLESLGIAAEAVVEALLEGLSRSPMPTGLIVCGMRQHEPEAVRRAAELALRYRSGPDRPCGVVGFDLAGPEKGFPPGLHRQALARVAEEGLPITLHAGEADEGERVIEAARLGARRIGHGVRLADLLLTPQREAVLQAVHDHGLHLEVCPTSNVQTGAARSIAEHPMRALWDAGVPLSFHTDNRLISCTTMVQEGRRLQDEGGWTLPELAQMQALAIEASFLDERDKIQARASLDAWSALHLPAQPNP